MNEYLTTREVAQYLRLNEKKVYALVAAGKLPAARISGKWLFSQTRIDQWVESHTVYPASGLMGALLDRLLVIQGSDDWLLGQLIERFQAEHGLPVPSASIGSLAGLQAIRDGLAHLAGCHVDNEQVAASLDTAEGCYLVNLFERRQGLLIDTRPHPDIAGLADVLARGLRWADRQPQSGTFRLARKLFAQAGLDAEQLQTTGPYGSHIEVALAILQGRADCGLGIQVAAEHCGLGFVELTRERFKLALPVAFAGHPTVARFMEFVLAQLARESRAGVPGYGFEGLGRLEVIGGPTDPPRPQRPVPRPAWSASGPQET